MKRFFIIIFSFFLISSSSFADDDNFINLAEIAKNLIPGEGDTSKYRFKRKDNKPTIDQL